MIGVHPLSGTTLAGHSAPTPSRYLPLSGPVNSYSALSKKLRDRRS